MRKAVPPRDLAATVNARALLRAGWAVALALMLFSTAGALDLAATSGRFTTVFGPVGAIIVSGVALAILAVRPSVSRGILFLVVGALGSFLYQYELLRNFPEIAADGALLLNRMSTVLVLVGAVSSRLVHGVLWCFAGLVLGSCASVGAAIASHVAPHPGWGPSIFFLVYVLVILLLDRIRRTERQTLPDFTQSEMEVARMVGRRQLEERAAAVIHDTVLSDLRSLATSSTVLDERARARIQRSLSALADATVGAPERRLAGSNSLRDTLLGVIRDFQWRGLTIDVSGGESMVAAVTPLVREAVAGALHASLDNVLEHAGVSEVDVSFGATEQAFTVTIVDHGCGFDPDAVPADRLGIRTSIVRRVESAGGAIRLWSREGAGTAVLITVPLEGASAAQTDTPSTVEATA